MSQSVPSPTRQRLEKLMIQVESTTPGHFEPNDGCQVPFNPRQLRHERQAEWRHLPTLASVLSDTVSSRTGFASTQPLSLSLDLVLDVREPGAAQPGGAHSQASWLLRRVVQQHGLTTVPLPGEGELSVRAFTGLFQSLLEISVPLRRPRPPPAQQASGKSLPNLLPSLR